MKDKVGAEYQAMQASSVPDCQGEGPVPFSDSTVKRSKAQTLKMSRGNAICGQRTRGGAYPVNVLCFLKVELEKRIQVSRAVFWENLASCSPNDFGQTNKDRKSSPSTLLPASLPAPPLF